MFSCLFLCSPYETYLLTFSNINTSNLFLISFIVELKIWSFNSTDWLNYYNLSMIQYLTKSSGRSRLLYKRPTDWPKRAPLQTCFGDSLCTQPNFSHKRGPQTPRPTWSAYEVIVWEQEQEHRYTVPRWEWSKYIIY